MYALNVRTLHCYLSLLKGLSRHASAVSKAFYGLQFQQSYKIITNHTVFHMNLINLGTSNNMFADCMMTSVESYSTAQVSIEEQIAFSMC